MTLFSDQESARATPLEGASLRVRMTIAYDGTRFHGFAANRGVQTVGGTLAAAITKVVGHEVELTCAGRTDTGVHAWGQVVHFDTAGAPDLVGLQRSLNKMLAPGIVVRQAGVAPPGFDARRSAAARRYRYTVLNRRWPDPFLASTTWHVEEPLDVRAMELACDPLIGPHDWSSFCRRPPGEGVSMVRIVRDARWTDLGDGVLRFDVEASSFCHQMVRSVVGTLVAVGLGKKRAGDMSWIIRSRDRSLAGQPAPPHGLCLWEVVYR
ncbi:MAG: tRNA pseudouridine(38-40) synthase TruA [Actinomycetota bacterium]|nr:tRNA pseudouridine(38-40) synthase TruA [Actinomycetota bacterium]